MVHKEINTFQTPISSISEPLQTFTYPNLDRPTVDLVDSKTLEISTLVNLELVKDYLKKIEMYALANPDKLKMDTDPNPDTSKLDNLPQNANLKNSSNNLLYKLQEIFSEDLAWDTPIVKQFILIYWVKLTIQEKQGNFITTRDIYEKYKKNCNALNEKSILTKASFYRLIWNSLLTAKIMYVKSQENGQKGIRGIQFKSTENYYKKIYNGQEIVP